MSPSRIVIINDQSVSNGGAAALALLSARLFSEAGYRVTFITGDDGSKAALPSSVEIVALGGSALLERGRFGVARDGLYNLAAKRLVEQTVARLDGPNVVYHLHGWSQIMSPSVFSALSGVQSRLLIHAHDYFMGCPNGAFFNYQSEQVCDLTPLAAKCLTTNCDKRNIAQKAFRVTRTSVRKTLFQAAKSPASIAMIHPAMREPLERSGLRSEQIRLVRNPAKAFRTNRVKAERNTDIYFIGRVSIEKGVEVAIKAARIADRRLRVIGDGPELAALSLKYPEVAWEGWLDHSAIAELIASARALVMPSLMPEPFGLVALEALQSGVPLVAFKHSLIALEAEKLGCAFLAPSIDAGGLASTFSVLDDDASVEAASKRAFDISHSLTCSQEEWRDRLLALYETLLINSKNAQPKNMPYAMVGGQASLVGKSGKSQGNCQT